MTQPSTDVVSSAPNEAELTIRGLILGVAMTFVFTAANVYLGLRVGLTFATSIPAAVISMALLRPFKDAGIRENNIVQTVASAAGTLASIIFVLPGLIMIGWWNHFPFWQSFGVCATGGILGVMFSVPLRRALVTSSSLPYPEGVAAAEVLKVGMGSREGIAESRVGLRIVSWSAAASAGFAALTAAKVFAEEIGGYFRVGNAATGTTTGFSLALIGVGHLVGISVGVAMFVGLVMAWGIATPILTALHPAAGSAGYVALAVWSTQVRFIGAGAIGVASLWKLGELVRPIWNGIVSSFAMSRARAAAHAAVREDQDIPIRIVGLITLALLLPMAILLAGFLRGGPAAGMTVALVGAALVYILVVGAFISAICGYMAALIGSSNSPVSGVGILAILGFSLLLALFAAPLLPEDARPQLAGYALFVTAIAFAAATIANDNLQDLKTGQLVGATPWRQQVALIVGCIAGALVIPPILNLLNAAYGFAGAPRATDVTATPLPAPQATLISALARGVLGGHLDWSLIGIGAVIGAGLLVLDALLGKRHLMRLPPLAVAMGIYLPPGATLPVTVGAIIALFYDRHAVASRNPAAVRRMGVLMAAGLIVGESLFGVLLAGLIVASGKSAPLALVSESFAPLDVVLGAAAFIALLIVLYRGSLRAGAS